MLKRTGATHLIVSPDLHVSSLADGAIKMLVGDGVEVKKLGMPSFGDLFPEVRDEHSLYEKAVELPTSFNIKAFGEIIHSSGTFP